MVFIGRIRPGLSIFVRAVSGTGAGSAKDGVARISEKAKVQSLMRRAEGYNCFDMTMQWHSVPDLSGRGEWNASVPVSM